MSSPHHRTLLLVTMLIAAGFLGWFLGKAPRSTGKSLPSETKSSVTRSTPSPYDPPNAISKNARDSRLSPRQREGIPNESLVHFGSEEAYRNFLKDLEGSGLRLLGQLDALRILRVGYDDPDDLAYHLGPDGDEYANFPVYVPEPPEDSGAIGGSGFGASVLEWLGVTGDNSQFGSGVTIAIIDTGVLDHRSLSSITRIDLVSELRGETVAINSHGTSVASLIGGQDGEFSGLAPGSTMISVRIGDENGSANSFLLAEGIVRAVDAGADLINISMGSDSDSLAVRRAIEYATENGALIVASAGNSGRDSLSYPAGNEGVIAVGAVDAASAQLSFSNSGDSLNILAPGLEILAATEDGYTLFSGTSASAPLLTGAIAVTADQMNLSPDDAYELIVTTLNEAGAPGPDPVYGDGILNLERVFNSNTSGIYDVALVPPYYEPASQNNPTGNLLFTVENRGTARVPGIELNIDTNYGQVPYNVGTLAPNQIETYSLPVGNSLDTFSVQAEVSIPANLTDTNPRNNRVSGELTRQPEPLTPSTPE